VPLGGSDLLTVTLVDEDGNPVAADADVTVSLSTAGNVSVPSTVTIHAGTVSATVDLVAANQIGSVTVTATLDADQASTTVTVLAGPPSAATSSLVASETTVIADGTSQITLTVTVEDAFGNPVAGTAVTLSASGSSNTFGAISGITDVFGVFSTTLASTLGQTETVTATEGGIQESTTVTFVATGGVPSAATSSLVASPATVNADGASQTTLTVTVEDEFGNPVAGTAVTLSASGSGNFFGAISGTTDVHGVFSTTMASPLVQTEIVTATENGVQESTTVTFVAPSGRLTIVPSSATVPLGGSDLLTVTLVDEDGNPVAADADVAVSLSTAGNVSVPSTVTIHAGTASATFDLVPAGNQAGPVTVTATLDADQASTTVMVVAVGPTAVADVASTDEDHSVTINVLANDSDPDTSDTLTVTSAAVASGLGSASVVANHVVYNPSSNYNYLAVGESATVTVSYSISDGHSGPSSSTATVTVIGSNDGPTAVGDVATTDEDHSVVINVLANDTDSDTSDTLIVTNAVIATGLGSASVVANQVVYNPRSDYNYLAVGESATVTVNYSISDGQGGTSSAVAKLTVIGVNNAPTANPDTASVSEDQSVAGNVVSATGLGHDTDPDASDTVHVVAVNGATGNVGAAITGAYGSLTLGPNGAYSYVADADILDTTPSGQQYLDTFYYTIGDGHGGFSSSSLAINITTINDGSILTGGNGKDTLSGGSGDDKISGMNGDDTLSGNDGADTIYGGLGNDTIFGGQSIDTLYGEAGDDTIDGGVGNDIITGGAGSDTLVYTSVSDSKPGSSNYDIISDFVHGVDKIDLTTIPDFNTVRSNPLTSATGQVAPHSIAWFQDSAHSETIVYGNSSGGSETGGATNFEIHLTGIIALGSIDFLLHH